MLKNHVATFRPIESWPGKPTPNYARNRSPFRANWRSTCELLDKGLGAIRAIAMALESLRRVDRYGVTKNGEQYKGWSKLGHDASAPAGETVAPMNASDAAVELVKMVGGATVKIYADSDEYRLARKRGISAFHPDRNEGDHGHWRLFRRLIDVLDRHHGL